MNWFII